MFHQKSKYESPIKGLAKQKITKPRSVGFRQIVSKSEVPFQSFRSNQSQNAEVQKFPKNSFQSGSFNNQKQKDQSKANDSNSKNSTMTQALLSKCLKPQTNHLQLTAIVSKDLTGLQLINAIQYLTSNKTEISKQNKKYNIKIGSKAQQYNQKHRSEPKDLVFSCINSDERKIIAPVQFSQLKKTERKNSPNIFICARNKIIQDQLCSKLNKLQEDMKKTKKPTILKLNRQSPKTSQIIQSNLIKKTAQLEGHYIQPKPKLFTSSHLNHIPSFQSHSTKANFQIQPIKLPQQDVFLSKNGSKREEIQALQKTKKIANYSFDDCEMRTQKKKKSAASIQDENQAELKELQTYLSKQQIQFVLKKLCNDLKTIQLQKEEVQKTENITSLNNLPFYEGSVPQISQIKQKQDVKPPVQLFSFEKFNTERTQQRQSYTLRVTDKAKYEKDLNKNDGYVETSSLSDRRNSVYKTGQKLQSVKNRLQRLEQGAKTVITKYDSSQKRSIIEESLILFQCSRDLKMAFSRQQLNGYAAKYRGSLGDQMLIRQNQDEYINSNQRSQEAYNFQNIVINSNNSRLRKSYSIHAMDSPRDYNL